MPKFNKIDLAKLLVENFGDSQILHGEKGRLFALAMLNNITTKDFLSGGEAKVIRCQNYLYKNHSYINQNHLYPHWG